MPDRQFDYDSFIAKEMEWATQVKIKLGTVGQDDFPLRLHAIHEDHVTDPMPLRWSNNDEKYVVMRLASHMAKMTSASALALTTDHRRVEVSKFCEHFGLARPTQQNHREFQKEYHKIMKRYGGTMANLPSHIVSELLMVTVYGPRIKRVVGKTYTMVNGVLVFQDHATEGMEAQIGIIPAWWN